ncbi:hypothetical protein ABT330_06295 [Streptomyces sp. NPDC000658]
MDTKMTKSASEYWVCCVLVSTGWGVALTGAGQRLNSPASG